MEKNDHIFAYKTLCYVLLALIGLTGISVGTPFVDMGIFNV